MVILGIETSCDETGAAIIQATTKERSVKLLSNCLATSMSKHIATGGIIPEIAAREQITFILPVIKRALKEASLSFSDIDAIAVTIGPGLIGSLLVGVETAKTLSYVFSKPLIPVNHLIGHIYANFVSANPKSAFAPSSGRGEIRNPKLNAKRYTLNAGIKFPALALIVSGGHTDLVLLKSHANLIWLGGTRDDAAGEAFDKIGRLLNLPYPGGPAIEKAAKTGNSKAYSFPRPMIDSQDFDFSFSGLKTSALRTISTIKKMDNQTIVDISASVQQAIIDVLVAKTIKAAREHKVKSILIGGGVAANQHLRNSLELNSRIFAPQKSLCTDNAAMIATAAFYTSSPTSWKQVNANPQLYFS